MTVYTNKIDSKLDLLKGNSLRLNYVDIRFFSGQAHDF